MELNNKQTSEVGQIRFDCVTKMGEQRNACASKVKGLQKEIEDLQSIGLKGERVLKQELRNEFNNTEKYYQEKIERLRNIHQNIRSQEIWR